MARLSESQANDEFPVKNLVLVKKNPEITSIYTFVPEKNISVINRYNILSLMFVFDPLASLLRRLVTDASHTM